VKWARKEEGECKWVLIRGNPIALEEQEKRGVFFDQQGAICAHFGIEKVPCRLKQEGKRVLIEEIPINEH